MTLAILEARNGPLAVFQTGENTAEALLQAARAEAAADNAELARDVAVAAGPHYASIAAGEAATTTGQTFAVAPGDGTVTWYRRTGGGSTEIFEAATAGALAATNTEVLGLQGAMPANYLRPAFTLPATINVVGDSFQEQPNAHTSGDSMSKKAITALGKTANILAVSGKSSSEMQADLFGLTPTAASMTWVLLGQNDAQVMLSNVPAKVRDLSRIMLANHAHLAQASGSMKVRANAMASAGTWAADSDLGTGSLSATANEAALQIEFTEARYAVVIYKMKRSDAGQFRILLNGVDYSLVNTQADSGEVMAPGGVQQYARAAVIVDAGDKLARLRIQILKKGATGVAVIDEVIGFSGDPLAGPVLAVADVSERGEAGYGTAGSGSDADKLLARIAVRAVSRIAMHSAGLIAAMGGRVIPLPVAATLDPAADLAVDEFHPSESGAVKAAAVIVAQVQAGVDLMAERLDLQSGTYLSSVVSDTLGMGLPEVMDEYGRRRRARLGGRALRFPADDNEIGHLSGVWLRPVDANGDIVAGKGLLLSGDGTNDYVQSVGELVLGAGNLNKLRVGTDHFYPITTDAIQLGKSGQAWNYLWLTQGVFVGANQVLSARGAAVADAVAAAAAPTQAEFNALVTQFNALLARVRAHGLIA